MECVDENIWYIKGKKKKKKFKKIKIVLILILVFSLYVFYSQKIVANIGEICYAKCQSYSTECVNSAIIKTVENSVAYSDIVTVEKNSQGDVVYIETNSHKINSISSNLTNLSKKKIKEKIDAGIKIPLFAFLGFKIFSGLGREINFKSLEIISVESDYHGDFKSVGINQTEHSIYLTLNVKIKVFMPLKETVIETFTDVLLCETVIVGKIPDIYLTK